MTKSTTLTASQVAEQLGTDGRTFRRFYRSLVRANGGTVGQDTPGKGKRYAFEAKDVRDLKKRFQEWETAKAAEAEETPETEEDVTS